MMTNFIRTSPLLSPESSALGQKPAPHARAPCRDGAARATARVRVSRRRSASSGSSKRRTFTSSAPAGQGSNLADVVDAATPAASGKQHDGCSHVLDAGRVSEFNSTNSAFLPYSMERISISWPPARTTSPAPLPIRARATGETYEIDPFRGSGFVFPDDPERLAPRAPFQAISRPSPARRASPNRSIGSAASTP